MSEFDRYVGLPWQERGRTPLGCDCWGLLRLVFQGELGVELPSYQADYLGCADIVAVDGLVTGGREDWIRVEAGRERPFDGVLMRSQPWHIGVVVRRGWMLHMPEKQSSVVEQYTTGRHARRVEGIYRHISQVEGTS